jgi:aromatic-amino-acid transaminase
MTAFPAYDVASSTLDWAAIENALSNAKAGDALLIQAGCHNPTGADPNADQWRRIGEICQKQGLLPLIDSAYQGLGNGLDEDVAGLRILVDAVDEAIITYSCDKNFGLYRDIGAWILGVSLGKRNNQGTPSETIALATLTLTAFPELPLGFNQNPTSSGVGLGGSQPTSGLNSP